MKRKNNKWLIFIVLIIVSFIIFTPPVYAIDYNNLCSDNNIKRAMKIMGLVIMIARWLGPLLLIMFGMIDFGTAVASNDENAINKATGTFIRRLISSIVIFLIPTLILAILDVIQITQGIEKEDNPNFGACTKCLFSPINKCEISNEIYDDSYKKPSNSNNNSGGGNTTNKQPTTTKKKVTELTYYYQGDYSNVKFCKTGYNVANNGCGATSLAMIASSYSNAAYNPKYVANLICNTGCSDCGPGGTPIKMMKNKTVLDKLGLKYKELFNNGKDDDIINGNFGKTYKPKEGQAILNAVKKGKSVILLMPNHYVAIGPNPKCTSDEFYVYNPGYRKGSGCYTPKDYYDATWDYSKHSVQNNWYGWHLAIAYEAK